MRAIIAALFCAAIAGCDESPSNQSAPEEAVTYESVQAVSSGSFEQVALAPILKPGLLETAAQAVEKEGYSCGSISNLWSLDFKKDVGMKIWKARCTNGSDYQLTFFDNKGFVKPWTGHLMGG